MEIDENEDADWAYQWPTIQAGDCEVVGTEGFYGDPKDVVIANARLCCAAPDLYDALTAIIGSAQLGQAAINNPLLDMARTAIAKAEGTAP